MKGPISDAPLAFNVVLGQAVTDSIEHFESRRDKMWTAIMTHDYIEIGANTGSTHKVKVHEDTV